MKGVKSKSRSKDIIEIKGRESPDDSGIDVLSQTKFPYSKHHTKTIGEFFELRNTS